MLTPTDNKTPFHYFLQGGGEMGELIRTIDWAATPLGAPDVWPASLKVATSIILSNPFPMYIAWGNDYIQLYNDGYRPILGATKHPQAAGLSTRVTFSEIWHIIESMFDGVMKGEAVGFPNFFLPLDRNGYIEECYFDFSYSPIYCDDGVVGGVLVTVIEVTEKIKALNSLKETQAKLEYAQAEAENQRDRLKRFFMQAPAAICVNDGPDLIFELINPAYQQFFPGRQLLGKPVLEALPEIKGQPIAEIFQNVYHTGKTFEGNELLIPLAGYDGGPIENRYFNFIYQPRFNSKKEVDGILVFAFEVTEMVSAKRLLEDSEKRFRNMIEQSPVPMLLTRGKDMTFEEINPPMLELINRPATMRGKPVYEVMPELRGQPIMERLYHTYHTGEEWTGVEEPILISREGKELQGYYNISYKPLIENGVITGVLQSAVDVTEQVVSRKELEKAKDTLNLSIQAAELGTFDMDLQKGTMYWDKRCRTLFGISHDQPVTYETDFVQGLHPDDRDRVTNVVNDVLIKSVSNGDYDVEYRTVGAQDKKLRWVKAKGKAYFDDADKPQRFIGAVLDITEQKLDELRKNDFIGMVSHELKTPLTSLSAIIQMAHIKSKSTDTSYVPGALEKAIIQIKKMSVLINGFLNVSRFDSGKINLHMADFDLGNLLKSVIEDISMTVTDEIVLSPGPQVELYADKDKIASVISNFLSNAVKYSPKGKAISVTWQVIANEVKVSISDEGIGIKPHDREKLFDRYYRVESKQTETISGFGIGLYLSAEIIQRHNGQIGVESELGKGSTFWFTLPILAI